MSTIGRPKKRVLVVTDVERAELVRLTKRAHVNRALAFRARLVLACAADVTNTAVARRHRTTNTTVAKWRTRFIEQRLDGLYDEPGGCAPDHLRRGRRSRHRQNAGDFAQGRDALEYTDHGGQGRHKSYDGRPHLAHLGLKPHVIRSFKISPDPQLGQKVRDVVGLYMNPPNNAVVFSFDEKSQIRALERAQPILPLDIGQPERQTHNYIRNGTLDLFAALNVATGEVPARCKQQHRAQNFVAFLHDIDASVAPELEVHVVLDNLSAHRAPAVNRWLLRHPRVHFHFTPRTALG